MLFTSIYSDFFFPICLCDGGFAPNVDDSDQVFNIHKLTQKLIEILSVLIGRFIKIGKHH